MSDDGNGLSSDDGEPRVGRMVAGLRVVSLCTLASRILGFVREAALAALFGNGRVLDAFTTAFAIPNLARALFGEGALSTAFLPLYVREQNEHGREAANRLASAVFIYAAILLTVVLGIAELILAAVLWFVPLDETTRLWLTLTAVMLPYMPLICLTAQIGAVLNAAGRFAWPALFPVLFNVISLAAIWFVQRQQLSAETQAMWLAVAIVVTGVVQLLTPWPQLLRIGFRFDRHWIAAKDRIRELTRVMWPIVLGLSVTQLNVLCDRLIALGFSRPETAMQASSLQSESTELAREPRTSQARDWRPLEAGTASALNQGQRLYQFPLGLLGVALGTVIFPLLTRHAEQGEMQRLRDDLALGLRLVLTVGLPASAGLWLLADPLAVVIFQRGHFTAADARQTAEMIGAYGIGVWAFCGLLIVQRGYYAIGDRQTPLRIGLFVMLVNLGLNLSLIWVIGGRGLALSTSVCGMLQFGLCLGGIQSKIGSLPWRSLASHASRVVLATAAMTAISSLAFGWLESHLIGIRHANWLAVGGTVLAAIISYAGLALLFRLDEFWMLLQRGDHAESKLV